MRRVESQVSAGVSALVSLAVLLVGLSFAEECLVPVGSTWKYMDDGSDQGSLWREVGFDDGSWAAGAAQLGYGDGDEVTVVGYGPDPGNKFVTTYFRHNFNVADPSLYGGLLLRLLRDDGAVVYLNGTEVARSNMPAGPTNYLTLASSAVSGGNEDAFFHYFVSAAYLVAGTNVLTVEIHQSSVTSSDISFDLELRTTGLMRKGPYLVYEGDNTEMCLMWQLHSTAACTVEWGPDTLCSSGSVPTSEYGPDHQHAYTVTGLVPSAKYFYRVIAGSDTCTGSFRAGPSSDSATLKFIAYGDTRTYPSDHDQVAGGILSTYAADEEFQTLVLNVGDLVGDGDEESNWDSQFFDPTYSNIQTLLASAPYQAAMGNHEGSGVLFTKYFAYPFVSNRYWSFDYGPAHFVVVDQYTSYGPGSAQLDWIEDDLASTTRPWRFVYLHEPGWSAGGHGNNADVQAYIQPLCEEHGVSILFAGHNHYYARAEVNGVRHITTGGGGAPLYTPGVSYPNVVTTAMEYHYCKIEIDHDMLTLTAVNTAGEVIDECTMENQVVSVPEPGPGIPSGTVVLHTALPNPFNPSTRIVFLLEKREDIVLRVYDTSGRTVRTLVSGWREADRHEVVWDGRDNEGRLLASGVYLCKLETPDGCESKKVVLLR
ncbi:MAG: metallophosphoesterase [Candidatus Eiseniibacteriota bacterium]|nr:MAG: metallophosphoesterase [Candidatus Eisenbacteria bacterium]